MSNFNFQKVFERIKQIKETNNHNKEKYKKNIKESSNNKEHIQSIALNDNINKDDNKNCCFASNNITNQVNLKTSDYKSIKKSTVLTLFRGIKDNSSNSNKEDSSRNYIIRSNNNTFKNDEENKDIAVSVNENKDKTNIKIKPLNFSSLIYNLNKSKKESNKNAVIDTRDVKTGTKINKDNSNDNKSNNDNNSIINSPIFKFDKNLTPILISSYNYSSNSKSKNNAYTKFNSKNNKNSNIVSLDKKVTINNENNNKRFLNSVDFSSTYKNRLLNTENYQNYKNYHKYKNNIKANKDNKSFFTTLCKEFYPRESEKYNYSKSKNIEFIRNYNKNLSLNSYNCNFKTISSDVEKNKNYILNQKQNTNENSITSKFNSINFNNSDITTNGAKLPLSHTKNNSLILNNLKVNKTSLKDQFLFKYKNLKSTPYNDNNNTFDNNKACSFDFNNNVKTHTSVFNKEELDINFNKHKNDIYGGNIDNNLSHLIREPEVSSYREKQRTIRFVNLDHLKTLTHRKYENTNTNSNNNSISNFIIKEINSDKNINSINRINNTNNINSNTLYNTITNKSQLTSKSSIITTETVDKNDKISEFPSIIASKAKSELTFHELANKILSSKSIKKLTPLLKKITDKELTRKIRYLKTIFDDLANAKRNKYFQMIKMRSKLIKLLKNKYLVLSHKHLLRVLNEKDIFTNYQKEKRRIKNKIGNRDRENNDYFLFPRRKISVDSCSSKDKSVLSRYIKNNNRKYKHNNGGNQYYKGYKAFRRYFSNNDRYDKYANKNNSYGTANEKSETIITSYTIKPLIKRLKEIERKNKERKNIIAKNKYNLSDTNYQKSTSSINSNNKTQINTIFEQNDYKIPKFINNINNIGVLFSNNNQIYGRTNIYQNYQDRVATIDEVIQSISSVQDLDLIKHNIKFFHLDEYINVKILKNNSLLEKLVKEEKQEKKGLKESYLKKFGKQRDFKGKNQVDYNDEGEAVLIERSSVKAKKHKYKKNIGTKDVRNNKIKNYNYSYSLNSSFHGSFDISINEFDNSRSNSIHVDKEYARNKYDNKGKNLYQINKSSKLNNSNKHDKIRASIDFDKINQYKNNLISCLKKEENKENFFHYNKNKTNNSVINKHINPNNTERIDKFKRNTPTKQRIDADTKQRTLNINKNNIKTNINKNVAENKIIIVTKENMHKCLIRKPTDILLTDLSSNFNTIKTNNDTNSNIVKTDSEIKEYYDSIKANQVFKRNLYTTKPMLIAKTMIRNYEKKFEYKKSHIKKLASSINYNKSGNNKEKEISEEYLNEIRNNYLTITANNLN